MVISVSNSKYQNGQLLISEIYPAVSYREGSRGDRCSLHSSTFENELTDVRISLLNVKKANSKIDVSGV